MRRLTTKLVPFGSAPMICGTAADISEAGLFLHVPAACGVTVGQRYELLLSEQTADDNEPEVMSAGCYATVVRTAPLRQEGGPALGVGMRFDQPLYL